MNKIHDGKFKEGGVKICERVTEKNIFHYNCCRVSAQHLHIILWVAWYTTFYINFYLSIMKKSWIHYVFLQNYLNND